MSFARYPAYKDSGVEWLGEVPGHWSVTKVRRLCEIKKRIVGELGFDVLSITQKGIRVKDLESNHGQLSMDYSKYQLVEPGDFAMNHMDLLTGYVDLSRTRGVTSPDYRVFSIKDTTISNGRYLLYLFQMGYHDQLFFPFGQGSSELGRWRLPTDEFNNFPFPLPPKAEQQAIATFLDTETAKIDSLMAEQRALVALLKEKRQAVISHAVTKGLNPAAPMKDSGVAWLGDVPGHWEVLCVRRISNAVMTGGTPTSTAPSSDIEDGVIWYTPGDFDDSLSLADSARKVTFESIKNGEVKQFPAGSVLIVSIGATLGKLGYLTKPSSANQQINAIVPNERMDGYFLAQSLSVKTDMMRFLSNASTIGIMNQEKTKDIWLAVPPISEQHAIVNYLNHQTTQLDTLTQEAQTAIALLQERRTALISAAVTGKMDVRAAVAA